MLRTVIGVCVCVLAVHACGGTTGATTGIVGAGGDTPIASDASAGGQATGGVAGKSGGGSTGLGGVTVTPANFNCGGAAGSQQCPLDWLVLPVGLLGGQERVELCRNATCATVPMVDVPRPDVASSSLRILFGAGGTEDVTLSPGQQGSGRVLTVAWNWRGPTSAVKDGDRYSVRLMDSAGRTLSSIRKRATYGGTGSDDPCSRGTPTCFGAHFEDDTASGFPDAGVRIASDGGVACCPRSADAPSMGPDTWCFSLGGTDFGGCFQTCVRACLDQFTMAPYRSTVDSNGCEAWVPDFPEASPVVYCG